MTTKAHNTGISAVGGIGLGSALFIAFLVLKLTDVIDWSWWWITSPLWGGAVFAGLCEAIILTSYLVYWVVITCLNKIHKNLKGD